MDTMASFQEENKFLHTRNNYVIAVIVFFLFFALWILFVWPAISHLWWVEDDYSLLTSQADGTFDVMNVMRSIPLSSRPIHTIWTIVKFAVITHAPSLLGAGVVFRLIQGSIHTLCAVLAGLILARFTERKIAILTVLPFLIWPFGSEATLWTSAAIYPIAACLSLFGILLLIGKKTVSLRRKLIGILLITLAPFANQSACLAGLLVYCMVLALSWNHYEHRSQLLRALPYLLAAYTLAICLNGLMVVQTHDQRVGAFSLPDLPAHAMTQLSLTITYLLTAPFLYPRWLIRVHIVIFAFALIAVFPLSRAKGILKIITGGLVAVLIGFIVLLLLRAPTIYTGMDWVSGRTMYLDPLLFSFALCLILQSRLKPKLSMALVILLLIVLAGTYYPISVANARENVTVYTKDIETLRRLESIAWTENTNRLLIAYLPHRRPSVNPYSVRYYDFGDVHHSVFMTWQYSILFVELYSKQLTLETDPALIQHCVNACPKERNPRWIGMIEKPVRALCFCP
ncbi:MAG: hypothetical protein V1876_04355 [Candidatus Peregrinibacteria bacterium]